MWCWLRRRSLMESYGSARTETVFSIGGVAVAYPARIWKSPRNKRKTAKRWMLALVWQRQHQFFRKSSLQPMIGCLWARNRWSMTRKCVRNSECCSLRIIYGRLEDQVATYSQLLGWEDNSWHRLFDRERKRRRRRRVNTLPHYSAESLWEKWGEGGVGHSLDVDWLISLARNVKEPP